MNNQWIHQIEQIASNLQYNNLLQVEGLQLSISAKEENLVRWVAHYLTPLAIPGKSSTSDTGFTLKCIYSDSIIDTAVQEISATNHNIRSFRGTSNRATYSWNDRSTGKHIQIAPTEGVAWLCLPTKNEIILIYSSRTRWPSLEFSRTARAIITQYLHATGWFLCHAGAVTTDHENLLIIGNSGAGKTTLILALLQSGANYIANELLFAKPTQAGFSVLPYAIPIAIGLGTTMQFAPLANLLHRPYQLSYPPRRLSFEKIQKYSPAELLTLSDKLQLLPCELPKAFPTTTLVNKAIIHKLVVPNVKFDPIVPKSRQLSPLETSKVLSTNIISITHRRFACPWLLTGFNTTGTRSTSLLKETANTIPSLIFNYHVSLDRTQHVNGFAHFLEEIREISRSS